MARSPIGCEAPCEWCWLVGGREEEAVSRVTGGQGAAAAAAAAAEERGPSAVRDLLEAAAPHSRVGAGRSSQRRPPRGQAGPGCPAPGPTGGKFAAQRDEQ